MCEQINEYLAFISFVMLIPSANVDLKEAVLREFVFDCQKNLKNCETKNS